jgi:D-alanine-D-alanine ligase
MRIAIVYNEDFTNVINVLGIQNKEIYNPKTVKKVVSALEKGGHNVQVIDGNMNVIENLKSFLPKIDEDMKFGLVFNMAYGIQGESRYTHIPALLEMLGIPYVGSTPSGHALALDKIITKIILQKNDIPTPEYWIFSSSDEDMSDVKYPVIVKPKMESVSYGLKVVYNKSDLKDAVDFIIKEFKQQALVEEFIRGREFAVGLLGNNPVEAFPVLEFDLEGNPDAIQTVDDKKYMPKNKICPAEIDEELAKKMQQLSIRVFKALGLRDFARVDIRLDGNNNIYILEINSMASLGETGSYVFSAKKRGYDYTGLVNKILDIAACRYFSKEIDKTVNQNSGKAQEASVKLRSYLRSTVYNTEKFLSDIVNINTHVRNIEGVNKLGLIIRKKLSLMGFHHELYTQTEVGNIIFLSNCDDDEFDFLFIGNLDNNVHLNKHRYFERKEQTLYGSGIWECKGGLTTMLLAFQSLRFIKYLRKIRIGIVLTTDESFQGSFSKEIIEKKSQKAKYVFGLHGAFLDGGMVTSRSGSAFYNLNMTLKDTSDNFNVPMAANVFKKILSDCVSLSNKEEGIIVSPKRIQFKSNITEPYVHGEIGLSVRFTKQESYAMLDSQIRKLIPFRKYKGKFDFQIEGGIKRPALIYTEQTGELYEKINKISEKIDVHIKSEHRWSSADISIVNNDKYIIDGFGPCGKKEYNGAEFILSHNLYEKALLLALLMKDLNENV